MKYVRAFIAGLTIPAIIAPFVMGLLVLQGEGPALALLPFLYFGPLLWGLWNILFLATRQFVPIQNRNNKIGVYGAAYGLLSALINALFFDFTGVLEGFSDGWIIVALVVYPITLYFVWKYGVNVLNLILEVY